MVTTQLLFGQVTKETAKELTTLSADLRSTANLIQVEERQAWLKTDKRMTDHLVWALRYREKRAVEVHAKFEPLAVKLLVGANATGEVPRIVTSGPRVDPVRDLLAIADYLDKLAGGKP